MRRPYDWKCWHWNWPLSPIAEQKLKNKMSIKFSLNLAVMINFLFITVLFWYQQLVIINGYMIVFVLQLTFTSHIIRWSVKSKLIRGRWTNFYQEYFVLFFIFFFPYLGIALLIEQIRCHYLNKKYPYKNIGNPETFFMDETFNEKD